MNAAFTKGPWSVGNSGHNVSTVYSGQDGIASVFGVPMHTRADEIPNLGEKWAEGLANARLIAAAPELYEVARLWADYDALLRKYAGPQPILFDGDAPEIDAAYDKARDATVAALAKARGQ